MSMNRICREILCDLLGFNSAARPNLCEGSLARSSSVLGGTLMTESAQSIHVQLRAARQIAIGEFLTYRSICLIAKTLRSQDSNGHI